MANFPNAREALQRLDAAGEQLEREAEALGCGDRPRSRRRSDVTGVVAAIKQLQEAEAALGVAFWQDTQRINTLENCLDLGKHPAGVRFVRRIVGGKRDE